MAPAATAGHTSDYALSSALARATARAAIVVLALAALVGVHAALEFRSLYGDGFYYFIRILEHGSFREAPARQTVELIRQLPLGVAVLFGVGNLQALGVTFGLGLQLIPLALVAGTWFALPRARKFLFVFPLLHVVAGTMAASYAPIAEGATAAAYYWLLLFCLIYNRPRGAGLAFLIVLAAGTILLHEAMAFLAPLLGVVAIWRARGAPKPGARALFYGLAVWFFAVAVLHAYFIIEPAHPANRTAFLGALQNSLWLRGAHDSENLPALQGLAGLVVVLLVLGLQYLPQRWRAKHWAWALVGVFGVFAVWELVLAIGEGRMLAGPAQFNARNNGLLISLPLAAAAFWIAVRPDAVRAWVFGRALGVCLLLIGVSVIWHVEATRYWTRYLDVVRDIQARHAGFISWQDALAARSAAEQRLMTAMKHNWVEPAMSIALSPGGNVRTIIGPSHPSNWQPFDPLDFASLPRATFWNYDAYFRAVNDQRRTPPR